MKNSPSNAEQVVHLVAKLQARLGVDADGIREGRRYAPALRHIRPQEHRHGGKAGTEEHR